MRILAAVVICCMLACAAPQAPSAEPCAGMSETDVASTMSAFRANVTFVERNDITTSQSRSAPTQRLAGSRIHVSPMVGVGAPWLTRVLQCNAARGDGGPFALPGTTVRATATEADLVVTIESEDSETASVILKRSESLARR